jgi:hypothetical protein
VKKPADILSRLRAQFDDGTLSRTQAYDWGKSLKEGWTEVENIPNMRWLKSSVNQANDEQNNSLIQDNHCITVSKMAKIVGEVLVESKQLFMIN